MSIAPTVQSPRDDRTLPWSWPDLVIVITLCLGAVVALGWYWATGPTWGSDMSMAIYRVLQLDRSIHDGLFYPVWAPDFNFTYGAPLFEYYPPLVSYVILSLHWVGLGWIEAAKATATLVVFFGGFGMYVYARWLFSDRRAALIGAAAYLLAPYFLTDIYERGAIAEALALALLPWLFWAMHHTIKENDRLWPWLSAALTAILVLTHNITALFVVPFLLLYLTLLTWGEGTWRRMLPVLLAFALGLGLSAFYWIPALFEREYAQISTQMLEGIYQVDQHLAPLTSLIQPQLVFDYWGAMRFRMSLWQAITASIALVAIMLKLLPRRNNLLLLLMLLSGIMLLQLDITRSAWQALPLASFIQFPWRLLGIAALCVALLTGSLLTWPRLNGLPGWIVATVLLSLVIYGSTARLAPRLSAGNPLLSNPKVTLEGLFERGLQIFTPFSDFLPVSVKSRTWDLPKPRPAGDSGLHPMMSVPTIEPTVESANHLAFQVHADQPFTLRFHRFFFPGWSIYASGRSILSYPGGDLGLLSVDLPAGDYPVVVQFDGTSLRRLGDAISIASLLAWVVMGIYLRRTRLIFVGFAAVLVVFSGLLLTRGGFADSPRHPTPYQANFEDEISLLGYHLSSQTWHPGDDLPLRLYWLAQRAPSGDYKVFVHLITQDDRSGVAQSDSAPILGYSPTSTWEPGEIIVDEQILHLDKDIPPGTYWLLTGLYRSDPARNLAVRQAPQILPGDRVLLTPIEIGEK